MSTHIPVIVQERRRGRGGRWGGGGEGRGGEGRELRNFPSVLVDVSMYMLLVDSLLFALHNKMISPCHDVI